MPGVAVIIMAYMQVPEPVPANWSPRVVLVDADNRITEVIGLPQKGQPGALHESTNGVGAPTKAGSGAGLPRSAV